MTHLRKDGTPKKKPGRKPLPHEVREERRAASLANRHCVQVTFPTAELAAEANKLLGNNRAVRLLAALHYWHGTDGRDIP